MSKIYISGANGFLGHHVKNEFKKYDVEILTPNSSQLNILDFDTLCLYLEKNKPDSILHMGAICGGILANKNSPADFLTKNLQMGINIFEAAKIYGIKKVYTLGSICEYPMYCPTPFKEDNIWTGFPEKSNSGYGISKRVLMLMGITYRQQYGIGGAHLLPVNMYGIQDHFDLINSHVIPALINKFITAIKTNKPIVECWGSGTASREFLFAEDCSKAIVKAVIMKLNTELPINIGTGKEIFIKDLAYLIKELTGYTGEIVFTGEVSDGQPRRMLDVSRAKELLGWESTTELRDGLKQTIEWYRKSINDM